MKHHVPFILVYIFSLTSHTSFKLYNVARRVKITALGAIKPTAVRQTAQLHLLGAIPPPETEISRIEEDNRDSSNAPIATNNKLAIEKPKVIIKESKAIEKHSESLSASKPETKVKSKPKLETPPSVPKEPLASVEVAAKKNVKSKSDPITKATPKAKSNPTVKKTPSAAKSAVTAAVTAAAKSAVTAGGQINTARKPTVKPTAVKKMAVVSKSADVLFRIVVAVNRVTGTTVKVVAVKPNTLSPPRAKVVKAIETKEAGIEAVKVKRVTARAVKVKPLRPVTVRSAKVKPVTTKKGIGKPAASREALTVRAMKTDTVQAATARKETWATAKVSIFSDTQLFF
jgi:hypothetical protein